MTPIHSLHDFFARSGAEVRLYHLGRRVTPLTMEELARFEALEAPWAEPWQSQARLACVFTLGDAPEPLIWFLALPLDEQGLLSPAPRDAFIQRLLETLGRNVRRLGEARDEADHLMRDNPLAFTPSLPFQALLHARASHDLERPASQHLELAEAYLGGDQAEHWQSLGLQGLADFAVRHDADQAERLAARLDALPVEVLRPLCQCLEHVTMAERLADALRRRGERAADEGDLETLCACVRAQSRGPAARVAAWYDALLADPNACGPDLLAAMAARGWEALEDGQRLPRFLTRLAEAPQADFTALARDLALIPRLRLPVLMTLRQAPPESAIAARLGGLRRAPH
ncbi:DUF3549 family protein [Halomonas salifodinae]|uniref:DUF3549 family protein n=1 Tax=Halomonas salifodinae TaxID=438745 RepID=UPI0033A6B9C5